MPRFTGNTEEAGGSFLGADFWKKGMTVEGVVTGTFQTSTGEAYSLTLRKPVKVNGEDEEKVSIGGLKGFLMALRAAGVPDQQLLAGDALVIQCTGTEKASKPGYNDQINFKVTVDRK